MGIFNFLNNKDNNIDSKTIIETFEIENRQLLNKIKNDLDEINNLLLLKNKCKLSEEKNSYLVLIKNNLDEVKKLKSQIESNKLEIKKLENNK